MADRPNRAEMPFLDHLEELRWRLLWSLLAVAAGTGIGWFVVQKLEVLELLKRPIAPFLPDGQLAFTSPTEPLMLTLKLAFVVGLVLSSPIVVYQAWSFLAPALYDREKSVIIPAVSAGIVLFLAGAVACYLWVLPAALRVLFGFQSADLKPVITIGPYFSFATRLMVAFGVVAELPLVVTVLAAFGLVTPQFLVRHRRYAIVLSAVVAAFLTPPDALSMLMMLVPMLLLYEVSILCAWVMARRRARAAARSAALGVLLTLAAAGSLSAQGQARDTTPIRPNRAVDTAAAKRLGLPTGPSRSFPRADSVIDSLLKLTGYRVTRYVADTLVVEGDSQTILLRGTAFVDRDGTQLEADSVRYRERACRLDAIGEPKLFDRGTVLVGDRMRYDTCLRRGTVIDALTDFDQGGATWWVRGHLAVDSGSTRLYAASSTVTTCELPVPHYHFAAREVKWINKNIMVARPAVLYIRDVPILWLPFLFQDIRSGRRSGVLVPRFGLSDLVRPSRGYQRTLGNVGYYFALNEYTDFEVSGDWHSGRTLAVRAAGRYRWLNRFLSGGLSYGRVQQLDARAHSNTILWNHQQSFDSRTQLNANINYITNARVIPRNTVDPDAAKAEIGSSLNFTKRFPWGSLALGGNRHQNLQNDQVRQTFPSINLTPSPIDITPWMTWSPSFRLETQQNFKSGPTLVPIPGDTALDTLRHFFDTRTTNLSFSTPLRIGGWNLDNSFNVVDRRSTQRQEFLIPDSAVPGGVRRVVFGETFSTEVDWGSPQIKLPSLFSGTWKLQPAVSIGNTTGGAFMIRNQFTGGEFVQQGKRLQFSLSSQPTLFGFFPGFGPLQRIRHAVFFSVNYQYAPGARVPEAYARAVDPTRPPLRLDPQQTISFGLSQNVEAKLRPPAGDTATAGRKVQLLSLQTGAIAYNFEQAKQAGRTGWTTSSITNSLRSELLPGFDVQLTHDLWVGTVGFDTTRFDPFLRSASASFSVTAATLRGLAALFGLGRLGRPGPTVPTGVDSVPPQGPQGPGTGTGGLPGGLFAGGAKSLVGAGSGFSMQVRYSSTRMRKGEGAVVGGAGGQQVLNLDLNFNPTANWRATWRTSYDVDTQRFSDHTVGLQRDMHRWQANFGFVKSSTGSFAFTFNVSLRDQPDIHFDYDQQSLIR